MRSRGQEPDQMMPTGRMRSFQPTPNSYTQEEVMVPQWTLFEVEARKHIAAHEAIIDEIKRTMDEEDPDAK